MADVLNVAIIPAAAAASTQQEIRDSNNFTNMCLHDPVVEDRDNDSDHDDDLVVNLYDADKDACRVDLLINIPNQAAVVQGLKYCSSDHQLAPLKELHVIQIQLAVPCFQMGGLGKTAILKVTTATDLFMRRLIRGRGPHEVIKMIFKSCPMSLKDLLTSTAPTRDHDHHPTCLRMTEDSTVLHQKESRDVSALDNPNVVPNSLKNIDMEIGLMLQEAGAMRSHELTNQRIKHYDDLWDRRQQPNCSSNIGGGGTIKSIIRSSHALLLIATLLTTLTYQVPFRHFGTTPKEGYVHNYKTGTNQINKQDSILYRSFILLNSTTFIASVGLTMFLLQKFPLKPWTQISVSALFGSYMFAIKAISPNEVRTLLFISIALLLLAVVGKLGGFARLSLT